MSTSRDQSASAGSASIYPSTSTPTIHKSKFSSSTAWVDPASLPNYGDISTVGGNAPDYVKQLILNTYFSYGVGDEDCFGHKTGMDVKFTNASIERRMEHHGRLEATTVAEVAVAKHMLNGAGLLHGACIGYIIDNCCSTPLIVLGIVQSSNGVGVTQSMNVLFHAPASLGSQLSIRSTSISLGGRVMSARCEIVDKDTGRPVASAFLNKMQPAQSKL